MTLVQTIKRSRPIQGFLVFVLIIAAYFFIFTDGSSDSYSPEDLNSMLQNKNEAIHLKKIELLSQGISSPYVEKSNYKSKNWDIQGNTLVKNSDFVRLTSDIQRQAGSMFSRYPINAESFEMELTFHIHGKTANGFVGDGMAIWLIDQQSEIGDVFGAKNFFNGLAIMIDTYKNGKRGQFPFVNVMAGDGSMFYNKDSDGYETRLAGCKVPELLNPKSGKSKARIVYVKDGYFSLDFDYTGKGDDWKNCVTLSDIKLPSTKYLGFSAETGGLSENHDIIENKMYSLHKKDGSIIESIQELEFMIESDKIEDEEDKKDAAKQRQSSGFFNSKPVDPKRKRKSISRLRNAERRIKERERQLRLEKYGDPEATFFTILLGRIWKVTKLVIYFIVIVLLLWVIRILYRVQKQRSKPRTTGLLD